MRSTKGQGRHDCQHEWHRDDPKVRHCEKCGRADVKTASGWRYWGKM